MLTIMTLLLIIVVLLGVLLTKGLKIFFKVLGALALIVLCGGFILGLFGVGIIAAPILIDAVVTVAIIALIIALVKKSFKKK